MKTMIKKDLTAKISADAGISPDQAIKAIESIVKHVKHSLLNGEDVVLRGFGRFYRKKRAKKIGRNFSSNTPLVVDEHFIPEFKPAIEFTNKIKKSK